MTNVDDEVWRMFKDERGLLHFPDENDDALLCGYDGPCREVDHPVSHAAIWCSACARTFAGMDKP